MTRRGVIRVLAALAVGGLLYPSARAQEATPGLPFDGLLEFSGRIGIEGRLFFDEPEFDGQENQRFQPSLMIQPEVRLETETGADRFTLIPYLRLDSTDRERTHGDLREANWQHLGEDWDLVAGFSKVFWGVVESRHLVDIVNQTDYVDDADTEEKLGQPMINVNIHGHIGTASLFVLPWFREPTWPGRGGRLRTALRITDEDPDPEFEEDGIQRQLAFAARWSHAIDAWDVGISHFHGTSREPRLLVATDEDGGAVLQQAFDSIDQTGLDVQWTQGAWLWKAEGISRWGHTTDHHFLAFVGGFEYTVFDVMETGADLGLLAEYLWDGRKGTAPKTFQENDFFVGGRLALNDLNDSELLLGITIDRRSGATFFGLEAERRIGDDWSVEVDGAAFVNVPEDDFILGSRDQDHLVQVRLFRNF